MRILLDFFAAEMLDLKLHSGCGSISNASSVKLTKHRKQGDQQQYRRLAG